MKLPKKLLGKLEPDLEPDAPEQYFDRDPDLGGDLNRIRTREAILETADNQIREFEPAREAYERMIAEGISDFDARMFIANLVGKQIWIVFKSKQPCDQEAYRRWLSRLPELPDEDEVERLAEGGTV